MPTATIVTFDELCRLEPRLRDLEREVIEFSRTYRRKRPRCANAPWYGYSSFKDRGFKARMVKLVGHGRKLPGYVDPCPRASGVLSPEQLAARGDLKTAARVEAWNKLTPEVRALEGALCDPTAYDVAYEHLYALLPDCRGCACC